MIFFTADNHFWHWTNSERNIIKYCKRPFSTIEEMNETMVERWNRKVKKGDTVYHLGDFSFRHTEELLVRLNGEKIFTLGDHDRELEDIHRTAIPSALHKHCNIIIKDRQVLRVDHNKTSVYCLHWCMRVWPKSHYNSWHLYAHSHGRLEPIGKSWDVGVDSNNFEPVSWDEIEVIMKTRPDNPNLVNYHGDKPRGFSNQRPLPMHDSASLARS